MKPEPLVSILLPVYNTQSSLAQCLTSLLTQSYKNIEIIAIDDNSKDKSFKILKELKKTDRRLKISTNKKRYGLAVCLNRALRKAKGNLVCLMDQGHISTADRIKRQVRFLLANPKVVVVGTQLGKTRVPTAHDEIAQSLLSGATLQFETAMINKMLLPKDLLYFRENTYPFLFSEVFVKLAQYGQFANLPWILQHRKESNESQAQTIKNLPSFLKHLAKSIALYDYRPSWGSLFTPLVRQA